MNRAHAPLQTWRSVLAFWAFIWLLLSWTIAVTVPIADSGDTDLQSGMTTTKWTTPINNLSMRVQFKSTVALNEPIEIELELRFDSSQNLSTPLPKWPAIEAPHTTLRLINLQTGLENAYNQSSPELAHAFDDVEDQMRGVSWSGFLSFRVDCEQRVVDLTRYNRDSIYAWRDPRSISMHESLPLGRYSAQLEVFVPESETGVWHGLLISPPFTILVEGPQELLEQTFLFPRELSLKKGPVVSWDQDAIDTVRVETKPNHFWEYRIKSEYGDHRAVGLPVCPAVFLNRDLPRSFTQSQLSLKPKKRIVFTDGRMELRFHFELIESILAPQRGRGCGTSDGFTFEVQQFAPK